MKYKTALIEVDTDNSHNINIASCVLCRRRVEKEKGVKRKNRGRIEEEERKKRGRREVSATFVSIVLW